jgi:hypothetical protein
LGTHFNIYSYTYSKPYRYAHTNTRSISYSQARSDSKASSHATSSTDSAVIPHLSESSPTTGKIRKDRPFLTLLPRKKYLDISWDANHHQRSHSDYQ